MHSSSTTSVRKKCSCGRSPSQPPPSLHTMDQCTWVDLRRILDLARQRLKLKSLESRLFRIKTNKTNKTRQTEQTAPQRVSPLLPP